MKYEVSRKLTVKGGSKRFWLENASLIHAANFTAGMLLQVTYSDGSIVLEPNINGKNKVSYSAKNNDSPVIDINNRKVSESFNGSDDVVVRVFDNKITVHVARKLEAANERLKKVQTKLKKGAALSVARAADLDISELG